MLRSIKRSLILLLVASLLLFPLCSCASKWDKEGKKVIGTCGGYDVLYEELRFLTLYYKDAFAATYGKDIWNSPESAEQYREELENTVWEMMLKNYTILVACAQYNITKEDMESDAIQDAVDKEIKTAIEEAGGKKEFAKMLKESYMTENFMRFSIGVTQMENELYRTLTDDLGLIMSDQETFLSWLEDDNCVYVQHLFIRNDPGDDIEANRQTAEEIRQTLLNSENLEEDLKALIASSKTNEDTAHPVPYYILRDVYMQEIEDAAFALKEAGDVSEVVEIENGYYVIVRIEDSVDKLWIQLPSLLQTYQAAKVSKIIDACKENVSIDLNDYGKGIDLLKIQ
jgi:hypothetical protein